ncbi:hypothetical protein SAMN04487820_10973 [Actinopolyspora mzabensis]|uniref:Uncharacterized protein n=1 Tax=Actinopolyspora mzabensis TaxID=995066 RepID=A0A1G9CTR6_ACTMZ|nr:hypothetical protein SAMN04487820_10973 [Actinopolyspora mzabensis]
MIIACHTQLRFARRLAEDHPQPWHCASRSQRPSAQPASAGSATSVGKVPVPPARQNPTTPDQGAHPEPRTDALLPATTQENHHKNPNITAKYQRAG